MIALSFGEAIVIADGNTLLGICLTIRQTNDLLKYMYKPLGNLI
jgi:hypothetical protein